MPTLVNSVISIVAHNSGRIHVAPLRYGAGGSGSNGHSETASERIWAVSVFNSFWSNPVPTPPAKTNAVAVEAADEQRSEGTGPVAIAGGETADHDVDAPAVLDLAPVRRAFARDVGRPESLRHHAFEILLVGGVEQGLPVTDLMRRDEPVVALLDELIEQSPPVLVGDLDRVVAVDLEHVEHHQRGLAGVALQQLEPGTALIVEHHQFGIEDRRAGVDARCQFAQFGIGGGDVVQVRGLQANATTVDEGERSIAVPLDLVRPTIVVAREHAEPGLHRRDRERQRHVESVPDRHRRPSTRVLPTGSSTPSPTC